MRKQITNCVNQGMKRDLGISQLSEKNANYAFENHNIRITAVNDNTLYTVTNEKGTKEEISLNGIFLGSCKLNNYIVLFLKLEQDNLDYIFRLEYADGNLSINSIYEGNLNFSLDHPIEAIGYYESEEVQKVYWVDGLNPNRFINIANTVDGNIPNYTGGSSYQFDFQGHIDNIPKVNIVKNYSKAGTFQAGTIQYFATYFNKYGVETCVVWQSDLQYISMIDRGANPEEVVSCSFDFTINSIDTSYDYIRIYAAYRAGLNGSAEGRLVTEIEIPKNNSSIVFSDLGNDYQNYNVEDIHYIGGQNIIASTLDYKQDTLFLGDIQLGNINEDLSELREVFRTACEENQKTYEGITISESPYIEWEYKKIADGINKIDNHTQQINKSQQHVAGFKYREVYRFGIQFMDERGEWTSAIWIGDKYCDLKPCNSYVISAEFGEPQYVQIYDYVNGILKSTGEYIKVWNEDTQKYEGYYILANIEDRGLKIYNYNHSPLSTPLPTDIYLDSNSLYDTLLDISSVSYVLANEDQVIEGAYIAQARCVGIQGQLYQDISNTYKAYRLLVAEADYLNRRIITQGILNPTMFNYKDRANNQPFSINSWIFRPRQSDITHKHYYPMPLQKEENAEIQGVMKQKFPGNASQLNEDGYDSFALIFAPNYLAGCRLWYKLIYYKSNSCRNYTRNISVLTEEGQLGVENGQSFTGKAAAVAIARDNQFLDLENNDTILPWDFSDYTIVADEIIKDPSWEGIETKTYSSITQAIKSNGYDVLLSESMLPTADQYKEAKRFGSSAELVWTYVGLAVALAASIVASIFSFGAAAPATGVTIAAIASAAAATAALSAAASASVLCAIGAAAAIGAIAENEKYNADAKDIEKQLAIKGISCINAGDNKTRADELTNSLLAAMFKDYTSNDPNPFYLGGDLKLGSSSNFYIMGGRLTNIEQKEQNKLDKADSYYIDESVVTLNSPDIENILNSITLGDNYRLDLVGTIPINEVSTDYTIYAEQGLSSQAAVIPGYKPSSSNIYNVKGLLNGYLYQDTEWNDVISTPIEDSDPVEYIDEVRTRASVATYKTFMWHRNTSLSLWMPGIDVYDPYDIKLTSPAAKPTKKIFANYRYSVSTDYVDTGNIYSLEINTPILYSQNQPVINTIKLRGTKYYMGNIDSIVVPQENYTLLNYEQGEFAYNDKGVVIGNCKDPIPLRYKSTPHIVVPIKSYKEHQSVILPTIQEEKGSDITNKYAISLQENTDIEVEGYEYDYRQYSQFVSLKYYGTENLFDYFNIEEDIVIDRKSGITYGESFQVDSDSFIVDYNIFLFWLLSQDAEKQKQTISELKQLLERTNQSKLTKNNYHRVLLGIDDHGLMYGLTAFSFGWDTDINKMFDSTLGRESILLQHITHGITDTSPLTVEHKFTVYKFSVSVVDGTGLLSKKCSYTKTTISGLNPETQQPITSIEESYEGDDPIKENSILFFRDDYHLLLTDRHFIDVSNHLSDLDYIGYTDFNGVFNVKQDSLNWQQSLPYLFLGELVKKHFDYSSWNGGTSDYALQQLNWNICSKTIEGVSNSTDVTWGDTYYQRWDCLKTYPFTEEEVNSNVEMLSLMLESHINLDGRSDVNRGLHNLINTRPSNSNIFNPAYNQTDNFFSYKVLDEKFDKSKFSNQIVWSLSKSNLDNIDKWTSISAVNTLQLDGRLGTITKIINVNDVLLAFQERGISTIDYNLQSALSTYEGVPLQMGNTGKVTGYTKVNNNIGCSNKWALILTSAGLFFIDNNTKSLYQYTANNGISNISTTGLFSTWFKDNLTSGVWSPSNNSSFRLNYDDSTQDLYIGNDDTCLLYNVSLQTFTSFMDYISSPLITNINGKSIALQNKLNKEEIILWSLFEGDYNSIYGQQTSYSMEYRINPSPYSDNLFTNYEYIADWVNPDLKLDQPNQFDSLERRLQCFDVVEAWNEYQKGSISVDATQYTKSPIKSKFRIWRGNIPRDGDTLEQLKLKGDRMRNPWIYLKFIKNPTDNSKMVFHNLNVIYYN